MAPLSLMTSGPGLPAPRESVRLSSATSWPPELRKTTYALRFAAGSGMSAAKATVPALFTDGAVALSSASGVALL